MDIKENFQKRLSAIPDLSSKSSAGILEGLKFCEDDLEPIMEYRRGANPMYVELKINKKKGIIEDVSGIEGPDLALFSKAYHVYASVGNFPFMLVTFVEGKVEERYLIVAGKGVPYPILEFFVWLITIVLWITLLFVYGPWILPIVLLEFIWLYRLDKESGDIYLYQMIFTLCTELLAIALGGVVLLQRS